MDYRIDEIETFLTVMELGSITAAAARMNLSKSVVSKRITDFETRVSAALFRRHAGRITPTEAAARLAERLRPALSALIAAAESAAWDTDGTISLRGQLAIAAPMSFGVLYLSPLIADFAARHPQLDIRVDYDDRARDLARDGFDIGVRIGLLGDIALKARPLYEDRMIACAAPAYLARMGHPAQPADLTGHVVIGYDHVADGHSWQFSRAGRTVSAPVRRRYSLNNGNAMLDMAAAGLGLVMLPGFLAGPALADGRLQRILPDFDAPALPITAVWPPVTPMPAKLRAFIDHLRAALPAQCADLPQGA